ncbi:NAD(P)-dependent oxidoreductase [Shinella sp. S4-D37]|uniref:NAD-dependent epimerase/dehydratase family protein n=1 Tax=Shinella sp. S4-D37 TaxID=3161999 RepID=UPI003467D37A
MNSILVTGAGGFLGRAIVMDLLARDDRVVALEAGDCAPLVALAEKTSALTVVQADVCDGDAVDALFSAYRPRAVVHCAAVVGVLASLEAPRQLFRVNVEGAINIFEAMKRHGVGRMIHLSSEEIYGEFDTDRIHEDHPQRPLHAYGISKAAVEHLGRSYRSTCGIECINIRTSWVYGPNFPRDRVPLNMIRAVVRRQPLHVSGGATERIDHTYLDDAVAGVIGALDCSHHPYDAYHVSSASAPSLAKIAAILAELDPQAPPISVGSGPWLHAGNVAMPCKGALDCRRAREVFGYRPRFDIRAGLAATLEGERRALHKGEGIVYG